MYIPKPALEDCLTSEISASGGDVMYDYITGSQIRRVHYYGAQGNHEFEIHQGCTDSTQLFLVGGGGGGGFIPSQSNAVNPPNYPAGGMLGGAGGGGGGGVLLINPDRELTGSLALVPGKYPIYIGQGGYQYGFIDSGNFFNQGPFNNGQDTTFKYAFRLANDADLPSGSASSSRYDYDSVQIKAGGGGFGSYSNFTINLQDGCGQVGPHYEIRTFNAADGGSGGGAGWSADGSVCSPSEGYSGSFEFPFRNQGNNGGNVNQAIALNTGGGGGGAGGEGSGTFPFDLGGSQSIEFIRGYEEWFSPGGPGQFTYENEGTFQAPSLLFASGSERNFVKGVGGSALTANIPFGNYGLTNPPYNQGGWIDDIGYTSGTDGEAIITYALTGSQLTNGKLTYIDGGNDGGIFTYMPCGEVRLETITVPAGKEACVCAMDTGLNTFISGRSANDTNDLWWKLVDLPVSSSEQYKFLPEKQMASLPNGSGTVTFTTGSDCNAHVPFEGWETCSLCEQSSPAGIYIGFDISGSSGRTSPLPYYKYPDTTVHYTQSQDYITSSRYNNHDDEDYFQTRVGAISNDYDDEIPYENFVPSASFSTSYDDQNVTFETGSQCFTYYDCAPITDTQLVAVGGETGSFVSGSGIGNEFIYKWHKFDVSMSADELTTRSYQEFEIQSGYSSDVNLLIVGPGGPGGQGEFYYEDTSVSPVRSYGYGAGGGAGQVKVQNLPGFCDLYGTLSIAVGTGLHAKQNFIDNYPDVYQGLVGQTIVSSSTGVLYNSAGIGGRAGNYEDGNEFTNTEGWTNRSGSGAGGMAISASDYTAGAESYQSFDGGDGFFGTGSAGGGGGSAEDGYDGAGTETNKEGEGGNGILSYIDGTPRYYAGGGAGFGPRGAADGGRGGGGDSGANVGLSTGSFYGGGGGAWTSVQQTYTTPWGATAILNGKGADGVVIINYKWKPNESPNNFISYRGLSQYYDMYSLDSYDGTGSLVYNLWTNNTTASLENEGGFVYDDDNLDSGSLLIQSASLRPYVEPETEQSGELTSMVVWEVNNPIYDSNGLVPILADENFGTSSLGIYGGDLETWGEAVVIQVGNTTIATESGSAAEFIPRGGFHISQFSYNEVTNELLWYVDGYSGSAVVNETISNKTSLLSFNSGSALSGSVPVGLGNESVYNITAIYTASLNFDEMRHNDDFLYPRY